MKVLLLLIPVIGGITGWLIISGAVKLLFWPRPPGKTLFNYTACGILPRKQSELASGLRQIVETRLKSAATGDQGVAPDLLEGLTDIVVKTARGHLAERIPVIVPAGIRRKIADTVEDIIRREVPGLVYNLGNQVCIQGGSSADICGMIEERIRDYDLSELEEKLSCSAELFRLKTAAAAVGFLSGLLQLAVAVLATA